MNNPVKQGEASAYGQLERVPEVLLCSSCKGRLVKSGPSALACAKCDEEWRIEDSTVRAPGTPDQYFGMHPAETRQLIGRLREGAVEPFLNEIRATPMTNVDLDYSYCADSARADPLVLLDFEGKDLLDVGCGWGAITIPAAWRAHHVVSVDTDLTRLRFLSLRARGLQLSNILPIHASYTDINWRDTVFDYVVAIGVLEWIPGASPERDPLTSQVDFLSGVRRSLKPGGKVLIGIENRLSVRYFIGQTDHGDAPFTPLMPRPLADGVSLLLKRRHYLYYTHTASGYESLLKTAGFSAVTLYAALLDYKHPVVISPLNGSALRMATDFIGNSRGIVPVAGVTALRMLARLNLLRHLVPAFLIVATR